MILLSDINWWLIGGACVAIVISVAWGVYWWLEH